MTATRSDGSNMTRLGFLLDSDSCIGCHACTVACKSEHDVPLGVNRTWVKYVERGHFPATRRHFSVMRCNHCDDAPCVEICPTSALFHASNGVVDFDDRNCIGCKACMNACPYDALYINPVTSTAHKCNFCNHRIDQGLEPSCVIVCPTQAIVVGDLDDPTSQISRIVARDDVAVRAPEQNTRPKVYYRGADQSVLDPLQAQVADDGLIWAEASADHPTVPAIGVSEAESLARTVYTTPHPMPWRSAVSAYLVTKAIAAGALLIGALLALLGHAGEQAAVGLAPPVLAGLFVAVTGVLLVADLKQPRRFLYLLTRPNTGSWLVRGAWILGAFAVAALAWFVAGLADSAGAIEVIAVPAVLQAAAAAGYPAWLFAQCEGRDLWQTPLLLPVLLAQAVVAGASAFLLLDIGMDIPDIDAVRWALLGGVAAIALLVFAELTASGNRHVELAVRSMTRGEYRGRFWLGGVVLGLLVPAACVIAALAADLSNPAVPAVGAVAALVGLFAYEDAFVRAGQSVPLS